LAREALTLADVHAFYDDSHILQGVSFSLRCNEVLALLGRNGVGKTTCVNTIMGLVRARRGVIAMNGEPVQDLPPEEISRRGIALVPQGRRIFKSLRVSENLLVASQNRAAAVRHWRFDDVYALFPRLRDRRDQVAGTLSGGEQQMLAIARALVSDPDILLLDEPSEGLAPIIVREIFETISTLKSVGLAILLVEQNLTAALAVADRVAIVAGGVVVHQGDAEDLRRQPDIVLRHLGVASSTGGSQEGAH
jgi:branched-chain amino acid transport system ATP-binding protein